MIEGDLILDNYSKSVFLKKIVDIKPKVFAHTGMYEIQLGVLQAQQAS